ncbi:MAG: hypothetical protein DRQ88_03590 [Epsilonproteobacteria bacterium]|nr:MAG: hypothetical protein DRQ89_03900 [Campylobacterota bacterium]RLA67257.1 MAG: hypothetical protein DRQ88_03590 [Campylobacterota bacterium]
MRLFYLNTFLLLLLSCGDIVDAEPIKKNLPGYTYRWNFELLKDSPLEIYLAQDLVDLLPEELDDKDGLNLIEQMADVWNKGHPELDFFALPFIRSENKDYTNLQDFQDDEIGIYPSYGWYKNLSTRSLAITQFFGTKKSLANGKIIVELAHADIIINFRNFKYSIGQNKEKLYDLLTVLLHEMGHMIGLPHPRGERLGKGIMSRTLGKEEVKRRLEPADMFLLMDSYPIEETKYLYDLPDYRDPLNLLVDPPLERFIIELMEDGHKHYHENGKFLSCDENIH